MDQVFKIIIGRLNENGMETSKIPSCIETLWNIFGMYQIENYRELNRLMQSFGWAGFELDEHTFKMARMAFDPFKIIPESEISIENP